MLDGMLLSLILPQTTKKVSDKETLTVKVSTVGWTRIRHLLLRMRIRPCRLGGWVFKGREQLKGQGTGPWKCSSSVRTCHLDETGRTCHLDETHRWSWLGLPPGTKIKPQRLLEQSPLFLSWILAWWPKDAKALGDIRSWEGFCLVPSLTRSSELTGAVLRQIEKRMMLTLWVAKKQQLFYRPEWGAGGFSVVGIIHASVCAPT